jgi:hypothetical protein
MLSAAEASLMYVSYKDEILRRSPQDDIEIVCYREETIDGNRNYRKARSARVEAAL